MVFVSTSVEYSPVNTGILCPFGQDLADSMTGFSRILVIYIVIFA